MCWWYCDAYGHWEYSYWCHICGALCTSYVEDLRRFYWYFRLKFTSALLGHESYEWQLMIVVLRVSTWIFLCHRCPFYWLCWCLYSHSMVYSCLVVSWLDVMIITSKSGWVSGPYLVIGILRLKNAIDLGWNKCFQWKEMPLFCRKTALVYLWDQSLLPNWNWDQALQILSIQRSWYLEYGTLSAFDNIIVIINSCHILSWTYYLRCLTQIAFC